MASFTGITATSVTDVTGGRPAARLHRIAVWNSANTRVRAATDRVPGWRNLGCSTPTMPNRVRHREYRNSR